MVKFINHILADFFSFSDLNLIKPRAFGSELKFYIQNYCVIKINLSNWQNLYNEIDNKDIAEPFWKSLYSYITTELIKSIIKECSIGYVDFTANKMHVHCLRYFPNRVFCIPTGKNFDDKMYKILFQMLFPYFPT